MIEICDWEVKKEMDADAIKLVRKAQEKDEKAFNELYRLYYKKAYFIALRMTNCDADAQDAVQDSFIQIRKSLPSLKDANLFEFWMHKIVLSKCKRIFRKNHYTSTDIDAVSPHEIPCEERSYMLPTKQQQFHTDSEILMSLIDALSPAHKEVLLLTYFEQYKYREVAKTLGITESNVKGRIYHAKRSLKKSIIAYENRNDCKLDFKAGTLGAAIGSAFLSAYGVGAASTFTKGIMFHKITSFFSSHAFPCTLATTLCVTGVVGGYTWYEQHKTTTDPPIQQINKITNEKFHPFMYHEKTISKSQQAYYTLLLWANTKAQILHKSKDEVQDVYVLYNALKQAEGPYWNQLKQTGWVDLYETALASTK